MSWFEQGPLACVHLADFGARVIKVEPPDGDPVRGSVHGTVSTAYIAHNRGKESITINLRTAQGQEIFRKLVERSDIVVHNFTEKSAENLGVDYHTLRALNRRLVYVRGSSFGPNGPRRHARAMDVVGQAYGGLVSVTGQPDGEPMPAGAALADASGALTVVSACLAGVLHRERFGEGCEVVVSLYGALLAMQSWEITHAAIIGERQHRARSGHPLMAGVWGIFATQDGHLALAGVGDVKWRGFCEAMGLPELATDPELRTNARRVAHRERVRQVVEERFRTRSSLEWLALLDRVDVVAGPVQYYDEFFVMSRRGRAVTCNRSKTPTSAR